MYNFLSVHMFHTLADLLHVRDTVLLCEVVFLLDKAVKQFSTTQAVDGKVGWHILELFQRMRIIQFRYPVS